MELAERMHLKIADFDRFLDVLNAECYLLKKGPRLYQVGRQVTCIEHDRQMVISIMVCARCSTGCYVQFGRVIH